MKKYILSIIVLLLVLTVVALSHFSINKNTPANGVIDAKTFVLNVQKSLKSFSLNTNVQERQTSFGGTQVNGYYLSSPTDVILADEQVNKILIPANPTYYSSAAFTGYSNSTITCEYGNAKNSDPWFIWCFNNKDLPLKLMGLATQ